MKGKIYSVKGKEKGSVDLPSQFDENVRVDLIKRGILAINSAKRQVYGSNPLAGKRQGKAFSKRRRKFGTTYGYGISRVKRKILLARGTRIHRVAAFISNATGGRKAHPPVSNKNQLEKINKKERRKAIRSAISATHFDKFPIVVENDIENIDKTSDLKDLLSQLNLNNKINKLKSRKVRKGKGKIRGRKYKKGKSLLFIVSKNCKLIKSAKNIAGADVSTVRNLNLEMLAPGGNPGRVTVWSKAAMEELKKNKLFL